MGETLPLPWHAPQAASARDVRPGAKLPAILAFMISTALAATSAVTREQRSLRFSLAASTPVAWHHVLTETWHSTEPDTWVGSAPLKPCAAAPGS
jgi:hypothetical protein